MSQYLFYPKTEPRILKVGDDKSDILGFTSKAIQIAADALHFRGGGEIRLCEGIFLITAPIRLYNNIILSGLGEKTILRKADGCCTMLFSDADMGEFFVEVEDTSCFETGMGIQVADSLNNRGYASSNAVITCIEGNRLYFDKMLVNSYLTTKDGCVSNTCPVIEAINVENVIIANLSIYGNRETNDFMFEGMGIAISKARNCLVENVKLDGFNGDGICIWITENITVRYSEFSNCAIFGMHVGMGSENTLAENCCLHHNRNDGLYICYRVQNGTFRNNQIFGNGGSGVSIGHEDNDNLIELNHIYNNRVAGIFLRKEAEKNKATRNTFKNNLIEDNGSKDEGYGIFFNSEAAENYFYGNIIKDNGSKIQKVGILFQGSSSKAVLSNNDINEHDNGDIVNKIIEKSNWPY